ncbi:MAG: GlsB/YeaQ/YmgE family stress response membrane protein [Patescibacteria group bacterium]|nr:GlsB/YeaQ/YmgE family stress response membrane protein [Patescibacteria group bacterium]
MGTIAFLVLGGVAGWLASLVMHTDERQGIILNVIVGVVGAFIGGFLFNMFGGSGVTGFNVYSLLVATLGAVILIWLVKVIRG